MSHTPHELLADFPEFAERIHNLKTTDGHFARAYDEYHEVNRAVHRAEARIDTLAPETETELRKRRGVLKDALYARLVHQN